MVTSASYTARFLKSLRPGRGSRIWLVGMILVVLSPVGWLVDPSVAKTNNITPDKSRLYSFSIDKTKMYTKPGQFNANEHNAFIVAGCIPKNIPSSFPLGSTWVACNDLDYKKDKVVESKRVTCLDIYDNGVLQGFFIKEVNNRTWQSFRFSCRDLQKDGTVGSQWKKAEFLFNYEKDGKLYETTVPTKHLSFGIFEVSNKLQLRQSLLSIGIEHQSANEIYNADQQNRRPNDIQVTTRIPKSSPALIGIHSWRCPSGMVMTGAAIGHIPNKKGKHTRPVYILAECRKLLRSGVSHDLRVQ